MNYRLHRCLSALALGLFLLLAAGADPPAPAPVPPLNRLVSGDYMNSSGSDILADLAKQAGLKSLIDPELRYDFDRTNITVSLDRQPLDAALNTIAGLFHASIVAGFFPQDKPGSPPTIYLYRKYDRTILE
ncbi:MAG: hypothetical protein ACREJQ_00875, partial [bacterium]